MSGWYILIVCAVCASGVLTFLKLVVNGLQLAVEAARRLEARERRAYERRLAVEAEAEATAAEPEPIMTVRPPNELPTAEGG